MLKLDMLNNRVAVVICMYCGSCAASDHLWPAIAATTGGAVPPVVLLPAGVVLCGMYA